MHSFLGRTAIHRPAPTVFGTCIAQWCELGFEVVAKTDDLFRQVDEYGTTFKYRT